MKRLLVFLFLSAMPVAADPLVDFTDAAEASSWRFFTDRVMGGVSTGSANVSDGSLVLRGTVSTQNNGGFIQARRSEIELAPGTKALRIRVRGDGQTYYLHIRTMATRLPWQYYQASFSAPRTWADVIIPLSAFEPSGPLLPQRIKPDRVTSLALVAYGRDHVADVALSGVWSIEDTAPD